MLQNSHIIEYETPIQLTLVRKWKEYDDVWSFEFRPSEKLPFLAGQNARIVIPELPEDIAARSLSFATTPSDETVMFAMHTNSGSPFKKAISALREGDIVHLIKIKGETFLPKDPSKPVVLIAGGIGITPFRSMMLHIEKEKLPTKVTLVHVCHNQYLYEDELKEIDCEQHRIRRPDIEKTLTTIVGEQGEATYYVAGPPPFIESVKKILQNLDVSEIRIRISKFAGYEKRWD